MTNLVFPQQNFNIDILSISIVQTEFSFNMYLNNEISILKYHFILTTIPM